MPLSKELINKLENHLILAGDKENRITSDTIYVLKTEDFIIRYIHSIMYSTLALEIKDLKGKFIFVRAKLEDFVNESFARSTLGLVTKDSIEKDITHNLPVEISVKIKNIDILTEEDIDLLKYSVLKMEKSDDNR